MSEENDRIKSKLETKIRKSYENVIGNPQIDSTIKWWNDFLDEALEEKDRKFEKLQKQFQELEIENAIIKEPIYCIKCGTCGHEGCCDEKKCFNYEKIASLEKSLAEKEVELKHWREGKVTEEMLRKNDGYISVGNGCELAIAGTTRQIEELRKKFREVIDSFGLASKENGVARMACNVDYDKWAGWNNFLEVEALAEPSGEKNG